MKYQKGHRNRVFEKFKNHPDSLADYELLEAILFYSIPRSDTKNQAKTLIKKFKSFENILKNSDKLISIDGIGEKTAIFFSLIDKFIIKSKKKNVDKFYKIDSPTSVINYLKEKIGSNDYESFGVIFLDVENKILEIKEIFKGTIDKVSVHIRELVKEILYFGANSIIIYHNHPNSIKITPSEADILLTSKIKDGISIIDVELLDHIIVSYNKFLSMKSEGYLKI